MLSIRLLPILLVARVTQGYVGGGSVPSGCAGFVVQRQLSSTTLARPAAASGAPLALKKTAVVGGPTIGRPISSRGRRDLLQLRGAASSATEAFDEQKHIWLEEVESDEALGWVRERNAAAVSELGDPAADPLYKRLLSIYESNDKIPYVRKIGDKLYNFWKDSNNIRGIWRRTTLESYRQAKPDWELVLDLDLLGKDEGVSWVWGGSDVLKEAGQAQPDRVLVSLSRGGSDAAVTREFDLITKKFVTEEEGGFVLPEGKNDVSWQSRDVLVVGADYGDGASLTDSGYPRVIKEWRRGTPLSEAGGAFEGEQTDVAASGYVTRHGGTLLEWRARSTTFYTSKSYFRPLPEAGSKGGEWKMVPIPDHASAYPFKDRLIISIREPWEAGGVVYPAGSLISCVREDLMKNEGSASFLPLFTPSERCSLSGWVKTKDYLVLTLLDNVCSEVVTWRLGDEETEWKKMEQGGAKKREIKTTSFSAVDAEEGDALWQTSYGYTEPPTLSIVDASSIGSNKGEALKSLPDQFNSDGLEATQCEAISQDGTRIPFFMVKRKDAPKDGKRPTLLYSYGGFEVPLLPGYSAEVGASWLEKGGVYVVANIRGGGEFGPTWHQAALRDKRQKAYDDFYAVGEWLVESGITSKGHLGIRGGSNGGLLVGNALVQRPDLWGAVVCAVPLLDMKRYHTLLAGASWMAEYGDPDTSDWDDYLKLYSPYHRVDESADYPPVLFTTSTRDDRVHPAHARKMVKRLIEAGKGGTTFYYENIEGGHGGAADSKQQAFMSTLTYKFLWNALSKE